MSEDCSDLFFLTSLSVGWKDDGGGGPPSGMSSPLEDLSHFFDLLKAFERYSTV